MKSDAIIDDVFDDKLEAGTDLTDLNPDLTRRSFVQALGAGLLITVLTDDTDAQSRGGGRTMPVAARLHLNPNGIVTVFTGKVEEGQGSRAELSQAAAEELHVSVDQIRLIMADTDLVPDDGITAGSRTTPINVPAVRRGAGTARQLLTQMAADQWKVRAQSLTVSQGRITHSATGNTLTYADLAKSPTITEAFKQDISEGVALTPLGKWQTLGTSVARPNLRDLVTGAHHYPSDIIKPNMHYGKILRAPSYGATLESIDLAPAQAMADVVVVHEDQFVGFAAPTTQRAREALASVQPSARWKTQAQVASKDLFTHLKKNARTGGRFRGTTVGNITQGLADAHKVLSETYHVAYIQHTPMEPRAATVQWQDGKLTAWTGVDSPQRVQGDLARTFGIPRDQVRVIVPDMGGGFGGKHSGEAAEEAARLSKAAGRPVAVHWTRTEEFTWAYFRPAAVIECQGGLDNQGKLMAWDFTSINPGNAALDPPYGMPHVRTRSVGSDSPLRQGAYRCLAATANNFARESFMDELAHAADTDPLAFRLAAINDPRVRRVLEVAAKKFNWTARQASVTSSHGVGLACGTVKGSAVAACVAIDVDQNTGTIKVMEVCEAFECGPIINPDNLTSQVQGCIMMGLGAALREGMEFADGRILNPDFYGYQVSRFQDVPNIEVHLVENRAIPLAGGGETPIIAVAPAIGNAVFAATGKRLRSMPLQKALREKRT
ncbi:MAG: xanthine dehydrogenase family protein molybdopterin-binding subunit [Phycisphaeraceae bacterium]|nr:xanthine dehydrogenase family protein molybdopterin-binding subunit [Phycisphaeraceae bacterium]